MQTFLIRITFQDEEPSFDSLIHGTRNSAVLAAMTHGNNTCSGNLIEVIRIDNATLEVLVVFQIRGLLDSYEKHVL